MEIGTWIGGVTRPDFMFTECKSPQMNTEQSTTLVTTDQTTLPPAPASSSSHLPPFYEAIRMRIENKQWPSGPWIHMSLICITYARRAKEGGCSIAKEIWNLILCVPTIRPEHVRRVWIGQVGRGFPHPPPPHEEWLCNIAIVTLLGFFCMDGGQMVTQRVFWY